MFKKEKSYIEQLEKFHTLSLTQYEELLEAFLSGNHSSELAACGAQRADGLRCEIYGVDVYVRGLIEITNYCRNDCYYCGIRRSNQNCRRYRLSREQILDCCREGHGLGFRTFVLQGGEGTYTVDWICRLVADIKKEFPECAVTLSLGEYSRDAYRQMYDAGADRYLLRHETADRQHYERLHPGEMSFDHRMECLRQLKEIGYQTGCGFMVGSPWQTTGTLAQDLKFIEEFSPDMCGIGPFIPQKDTPLGKESAGTAELTAFLLSLIRLIKPNILLPATTALGTIREDGREMGIRAGANVVMPNLSPLSERKKYALYDHKICTGEESAQNLEGLKRRMEGIGYRLVMARGDIIHREEKQNGSL